MITSTTLANGCTIILASNGKGYLVQKQGTTVGFYKSYNNALALAKIYNTELRTLRDVLSA